MFDTIDRTASVTVDRRKFLAAAAGLVAAGVLPKSVLALAGPYNFKQGAFDITVVSDGTLTLPIAAVFPESKPEDIQQLLSLAADAKTSSVEENALLLKSGTELILLDAGSGPGFQDTAGKIVDSLNAAGTDPAAITRVIFTHAHPDHLWGAMGGSATPFTNASFHVAEAEWNFWTMPDLATKMPKQMEAMVKTTQGHLAAIEDKVSMYKPGAEVVSGPNVLDTAGHTPGHVSFEIGGGDGLLITGDAITVPQVFFAHPDWKFGFDADHAMATENRKKLLSMAAANKRKMLGYHWPYPGIGYAEAKDSAFAFVTGA